ETADDWLILAVGNDGQWQQFCRAADRGDLSSEARFRTNPGRVEHREVLVPIVADIMRSKKRDDWEQRLTVAGVPCAPVWTYAQLFADSHVAARGMKVSVKSPDGTLVDLVGSPVHIAGLAPPPAIMPPILGQDTDAVLSDAGFTGEEI